MMVRAEPRRISLDDLVQEWKYRCSIEKDAHVVISGDEGDGKSVLDLIIVKEKFKGDLWGNIVYSKNPKEFYDKYPQAEGVMAFDEALDILDRLNWAKVELRELVKKFRADVRKEKNMVFLYNVQLFRDLHGYWRNHRIRYWIELTPREWFDGVNYGYVLKRQRVPFITGKRDTWLLDDTEKLWMDRMKSGAIIGEDYLNMLRTHPFYLGEFKFKNVKPSIYKEYLKRREEAKEEYEKENMFKNMPKRELLYRSLLGKLMKYLNEGFQVKCKYCNIWFNYKFKQQDIAEILERKQEQVAEWISFRRQLEEAGIEV